MMAAVLQKLSESELDLVFSRIARRKLKKKNKYGCIEVLGGARMSVNVDKPRGGYPCMKITATSAQKLNPSKDNAKVLPLHVIIYYKYNKKIADRANWEVVSHLCHHKSCINIQHLSLETKTINEARKKCVSATKCLKNHRGYRNCFL